LKPNLNIRDHDDITASEATNISTKPLNNFHNHAMKKKSLSAQFLIMGVSSLKFKQQGNIKSKPKHNNYDPFQCLT
jgi:hypothetical protein